MLPFRLCLVFIRVFLSAVMLFVFMVVKGCFVWAMKGDRFRVLRNSLLLV